MERCDSTKLKLHFIYSSFYEFRPLTLAIIFVSYNLVMSFNLLIIILLLDEDIFSLAYHLDMFNRDFISLFNNIMEFK